MKYSILLALLFSSLSGFNQRNTAQLLQKTKQLVVEQSDSSLIYVSEVEAILSKEEQNKNFDFLLIKAILAKREGKFEEAASLLTKAKAVTDTPKQTAEICVEQGTIHLLSNNLTKASQSYTCALDFYEKQDTNDPKIKEVLVRCYGNLGIIKRNIQDFDSAIQYFEKAVSYSVKKDKAYYSLWINISNLYSDQQNHEKAIETSDLIKKKLEQTDYKDILSTVYNNLCNFNRRDEKLNEAIFYGEKALQLKEELGLDLTLVKNNLALCYVYQNKNHEALDLLLPLADKKDSKVYEHILSNISASYQGLGNHEKALEYANLVIAHKDSVSAREVEKKVAEILAPYENQKKEQEINFLNKENELKEKKLYNKNITLIGSIMVFSLLSLLAFSVFKYKEQKQNLQKANIQNKLLRTQLNPHFLFHSLQNIQNFIYRNEKDKSLRYLKNYSQLIRSIFDTSDDDFITIEKDVEIIKTYLELEQLSKEQEITIDFSVDEEIEEYSIPPLLVQPYVENALIHGLEGKEDGYIAIAYKDCGHQIKVIIEDNGEGDFELDKSLKLNKNSSTKVIQKRIEQLAKGHDFSLSIKENKKESGLQVIIVFDKIIKV